MPSKKKKGSKDDWSPEANPSGPVLRPDRSKAEKKAAEAHKKSEPQEDENGEI